MKNSLLLIIISLILISACTSEKKLAYLNNLPSADNEATFTMKIPDYLVQPRDILSVTVKAMNPDGKISDFLASASSGVSQPGESSLALLGYDVDSEGNITIPVVGTIKISGLTLEEARKTIQASVDKVFKNSTVECKLLSFKYTVIGEVRSPGTYTNFNNYLTVLEALGRAGGIGDYGNRDKILVIRPFDKGTKTFRINLQDSKILSSEGYFLLPNDVVIVQPLKQKIFTMNLPTISFIISAFTGSVSMTLLLINFMRK